MLKRKLKQIPTQGFTKEAQKFGNHAMQWLFGLPADWYQHRDIGKNNIALGQRFLKLGYAQDALFRFKLASWVNKTNADIWVGLGRAYLLAGKRKEAEQ